VDYVFNHKARCLDLFGYSAGGTLRLVKEIGRYRRERRGMITTNFAEAGGFLKTLPGAAAPDVQLHFVIGIVDNHARTTHLGHGYSLHVCLLRPKSAGRVKRSSFWGVVLDFSRRYRIIMEVSRKLSAFR